MTPPEPVHRPIRIAFCHYTADYFGGSDRSLFDLVINLPPERFAPLMILKTGDPMIAEYRARQIPVVDMALVPPRRAFEARKLAKFFRSYWPAVYRVTRAAKRHETDIMHVNTLYNLQGPMAARLLQIPLVWHVRELVPDSKSYDMLAGIATRFAARVVAISSTVAERFAACGRRLRIVNNSTDVSHFDEMPDRAAACEALNISSDRPIILCLGRLEPWKGQHILLEAVPHVLERIPDACVLFAGGPAINKPDYGPGLEARALELGLRDHVRFTGMVDDVRQVLAACSVLALPTVTPEPFGLTVVEAMAAGRPVVATAAGGPLDSVVDGETGLLARPGDAVDLAEKLVEVLSDVAWAEEMGRRGRKRAEEHFTIAREAGEMAALFEEVYQEGPFKRYKERWPFKLDEEDDPVKPRRSR